MSNTTNVAATPHTIARNTIRLRARDANRRAVRSAIRFAHYTGSSTRKEAHDQHPARAAPLHLRRLDVRCGAALVVGAAVVSPFGEPADARSDAGSGRSARRTARHGGPFTVCGVVTRTR